MNTWLLEGKFPRFFHFVPLQHSIRRSFFPSKFAQIFSPTSTRKQKWRKGNQTDNTGRERDGRWQHLCQGHLLDMLWRSQAHCWGYTSHLHLRSCLPRALVPLSLSLRDIHPSIETWIYVSNANFRFKIDAVFLFCVRACNDSLQQWFEYCSNTKKCTCPVCKQLCSSNNANRLYFQSVGDSNDPILTQKTIDYEEGPEELCRELRRLETKVSGLTSVLEQQGKRLKEANEEVM